MEILDLAVSLRDSLPDSGRSCQHTVWWGGCRDVDVGMWMWGAGMWEGDVGGVYVYMGVWMCWGVDVVAQVCV